MLGFGAISAWAISFFGTQGSTTPTDPANPGDSTNPTNPTNPADPSVPIFSVKVRYIRIRAPLSSKTNFK